MFLSDRQTLSGNMMHEEHNRGQSLGLQIHDCRLPIRAQDAWGRPVEGPWCRLICDGRDGSAIAVEILAERPIDPSIPKVLQLLISCTPFGGVDPRNCDVFYPRRHMPADGIFTLAQLRYHVARWVWGNTPTPKKAAIERLAGDLRKMASMLAAAAWRPSDAARLTLDDLRTAVNAWLLLRIGDRPDWNGVR
jgi:hypothetical protein